MKLIILLLRARFNPAIGRSAASAFVDGVLRREPSNWNRNGMIALSRLIGQGDRGRTTRYTPVTGAWRRKRRAAFVLSALLAATEDRLARCGHLVFIRVAGGLSHTCIYSTTQAPKQRNRNKCTPSHSTLHSGHKKPYHQRSASGCVNVLLQNKFLRNLKAM